MGASNFDHGFRDFRHPIRRGLEFAIYEARRLSFQGSEEGLRCKLKEVKIVFSLTLVRDHIHSSNLS